MVNCAAYGCRSGYKSKHSTTDEANKIKLSYHAFPLHDLDLCDKWIRAIRRKEFVATKYSKVCSLHFKEADFIAESRDSNKRRRKSNDKKLHRRYLKDDAVPSILPIASSFLTNIDGVPRLIAKATMSSQLEHEGDILGQMEKYFLAEEDDISQLSTEHSQDKNSTRRKRNREKRASYQRYLKKDAIPSVLENAAAPVSHNPQPSTRTTLNNRLEEDREQLATREPSFTANDDASHSILSDIHDEIVNETSTPKGSTILSKNNMVSSKCSGVGCRSGYRDCPDVDENGEKISFHYFPIGNPELCEKWIQANLRKDFIPTKHSRLCSRHFLPRDFIQEFKDTDVSRQKKRNMGSEKPNRRHLKDDAIPSVFPNAPAGTCLLKTQIVPSMISRTSSPSRYPEEEERRASLQQTSPGIGDISDLTLGIEEQLKDQNISFNVSGRGEHFINIAETLVKYRENGILCDTVLVAKCGRELRAHSALLAAVSPVFLMAIQEQHSSGLYHLCFPEVEFEVLEIAVHFIYTGNLLLPPRYSQMNQLSTLFDKLSDLGLSSPKLHECEMTFMRRAKQPPNSLKSIKVEDTDNKPSLKDSVPKLNTSDEWSVDKTPSFAHTSSEAMLVDVASNDARMSQTEGDAVESNHSTLVKEKRQRNRKQERQERRSKKSLNNNVNKMPSSSVVPSDTVVAKPVMKPAFFVLKSLTVDLSKSATALTSSDTGLQELNNVPVGLLSDQNEQKINTFDSNSFGIHEAIVNDNGELNSKTQGGNFKLANPSLTEESLGPGVVEKQVDKAGVTSNQVLTCEHCKGPITKTFTTEIELLSHKTKHHWDQCNMCNYCGRRLSSRRYLIFHVKRHLGINPQKTHKCNDCGLHFLTRGRLKIHRVRHTGEKPYECPECKKCFTLQKNMERHQLVHTGCRPFLCDLCGKKFTRKTNLTHHVTAHHEFECAFCGCKPTSKADMEKHALEVHQVGELVRFNSIIKNPGTYLCDLCGKNCISAGSLRFHIRGHRKKPVHCKTYDNTFSKFNRLRLHMSVHTGERPFVCNVCRKGFTQKSVLMTHLTIHSGIKPFLCIICFKSFGSKGQLNQHTKHHPNQCTKRHTMNISKRKQFICGVCNNQFTSKYSLVAHHRIHTGERPYKCRTCGKQFIYNSTLTIHIRSHTGEKPFPCTVCEKSFAQSQHLVRHMRTHTGEKPFVCEICSKSYKQKIDLRFHFIRFHKIDLTSKSLSVNTDIDRTVKVLDSTDRSDCKL